MNWLTRGSKRFLTERGGSWPRYFRRLPWFSVPMVLLYRTSCDYYATLKMEQASFYGKNWLPFVATGALFLLSSTAATLASTYQDKKREHLIGISSKAFSAGMNLLPVTFVLYGLVDAWNTPLTWWSLLYFVGMPFVVGAVMLFVDLLQCMDSIVQHFINWAVYKEYQTDEGTKDKIE